MRQIRQWLRRVVQRLVFYNHEPAIRALPRIQRDAEREHEQQGEQRQERSRHVK